MAILLIYLSSVILFNIEVSTCFETKYMYVAPKESVQLPCLHHSHKSILLVRWSVDNNTAPSDNTIVALLGPGDTEPTTIENYDIGSDFSLIINEANMNNQGVFECYVVYKDSPPSVHDIRLIVEDPTSTAAPATDTSSFIGGEFSTQRAITTKTRDSESGPRQIPIAVITVTVVSLAVLVILIILCVYKRKSLQDYSRIVKMALKGKPCGYQMKVLSFNVEGITTDKEQLLGDICRNEQCQVLCLQETHRGQNDPRPNVPGMTPVAVRQHKQHGSAIFVKSDIAAPSADVQVLNYDTEALTVIVCGDISITSIYKPPTRDFHLTPDVGGPFPKKIFIGDFNCHGILWGYQETDKNGKLLENWMHSNNLQLIHDPNLPHSFVNAPTGSGYNPDLIFVSSNLAPKSTKFVLQPVPHSQHRPIGLLLDQFTLSNTCSKA